MSIRNVDLGNITRKGKGDLIDSKIIEFEDNFSMLEDHLNQVQAVSQHLFPLISF